MSGCVIFCINEVKFCYERELVKNETLQGRVTVEFTVLQSGQVAQSAVMSSTMDNLAVEQCIAKAVARWQFPESGGSGLR